ncbi:MAG: hypothetical protein ACM3QU_15625 [Verrucomicrobiota bacterium]
MTLTLDTRARMLLLVLLFVLAASLAAFMSLRALHHSSGESAPVTHAAAPATKTHGTTSATSKPAVAPHSAPATHPHATAAAAPRHAPAVAPKAKPAAPSPVNDLPAAVRKALAADRVVVIALYDPNAKIDKGALAEAKAGARLGHGAFVPIDVRSHAVDSLNARYGAVQDPAVLVLRPPDSLVVRIDGFADKDTVAQAALNAAHS